MVLVVMVKVKKYYIILSHNNCNEIDPETKQELFEKKELLILHQTTVTGK